MENATEKLIDKRNCIARHLLHTEAPMNITFVDFSHRNLNIIDVNVEFPPNLLGLKLSHNNFVEIPTAVMKLNGLKLLDLSFNKIQYFDGTPNFCQCIERLNLSNNELKRPPYWVWSESPGKLTELDLSCNVLITNVLENGYFDELLQYTALVTHVKLFNCRLTHHIDLLQTFSKAKVLELGTPDFCCLASNHIDHVPCQGLNQCCDIQRLNLSNTQLYSIESNIDIYKNLLEINLSYNRINHVPSELCHLEKLQIVILSGNHILYLPDDMHKLKKLTCLRLDCNQLCMLPDNLAKLPSLKILDLYDNSLYEVDDGIKNIAELDLAQNYLEEPEDADYLERKEKLRLNINDRKNGRKIEVEKPDNSHSPDTTDDEELINYLNNQLNEPPDPSSKPPSSPEDWDSDDYWIPCEWRRPTPLPYSPWYYYVQQKMREGNFCPMDVHPVSVAEQVKYEQMCNPTEWREAKGQFDDLSDDDS